MLATYEVWVNGNKVIDQETSRIRAIEEARRLKGTVVMIRYEEIVDAWDFSEGE